MNKVVTLAQVLKRMATDNAGKAKAWMFSNHPTNTLVVTVGKAFNIDNYKYNQTVAMLIANLLAVGSSVRLVQGKSIVTIKCHDEVLIDHYRLEQVGYMLMGQYDYDKREYKNANGPTSMATFKKHNEGSFYYQLLKTQFNSLQPALEFFNSAAWKDEMETYRWKYNLLELLVPALCDFQEEYLLTSKALQYNVAKEKALLRNEYYQLGIDSKLFNGEIPNQDVQALQMPGIKVQQKFIEGQAPYISTTGDYEVTPNSEIEAKLVNAWYYSHDEFRLPSHDEQLQELAELEEWFAVVKHVARLTNQRTFDEETLAKFDRLEELQFKYGYDLVQYNPEIGKDTASADYYNLVDEKLSK